MKALLTLNLIPYNILMRLVTERKRQIEEIISVMECPWDFVCYKSGFEKFSKVRIIGDAKLVECLEKRPQACQYGFAFGQGSFRKYPLRCYIAKNFHK